MKNKLTIHVTKKYFYITFLVTTILIVIPLLLKMLLSLKVWYGDEFIYPLLSALNSALPVWIIGAPLLSWVLITYIFFKRMMNYLEEVLHATKKIVTNPNKKISLKTELFEFENEINQIRLDNLKNKQAAEEANKKKNDLIVYLAHDLRTPLTSIIGYSTLLQNKNLYGALAPKVRTDYIKIILDKAHQLEILINDLFEIVKFGSSKEQLVKKNINMSLMLAQIASEFLPILNEKKLRWSLDIEDGVFTKINTIKFERVLENIIKNAITYAPQNTELKLSLHKKNEKSVIAIQNVNYDLTPEVVGHLFEPFFRADQSRSTKTGNAGLGLAIARQIINEHEGSIKIDLKDDKFMVEITL